MSMDNKNEIYKLNCFSNLSTKYCEPKRGKKKTFHETIQGNKDFLFNFFDSQPYYNELMPTIIKNSRGGQFYKKIIRKGLDRKSDFFKNILKAIETSNKEEASKSQEKKRIIRYYKIPRLELLKKRQEKYENYLEKKNKTLNYKLKPLKKSNSMLQMKKKRIQVTAESIKNSTINNNNTLNNIDNKNNNLNNTISLDTFHTSNKYDSMKNFHNNSLLNKKTPYFYVTRNSNMEGTYKSIKDTFTKYNPKSKRSRFEKILNKCNEELSLAQNRGDDVEKYNRNKSGEEIGKKLKNVLKNRDQKVIEEKDLENKKYKKLEKEKFNELKRKMDLKVSDDYAYVNRKELHEFMRDNENIYAYQIYLREMNKINENIGKKKEIEKKNISLVENLLENTYRQKEFLKYKIDNYYTRHAKQDELKIFSLQNKDDYFVTKNNDKEELKGNLLPKLIELKDYCYGRAKYNPLDKIDNTMI